MGRGQEVVNLALCFSGKADDQEKRPPYQIDGDSICFVGRKQGQETGNLRSAKSRYFKKSMSADEQQRQLATAHHSGLSLNYRARPGLCHSRNMKDSSGS